MTTTTIIVLCTNHARAKYLMAQFFTIFHIENLYNNINGYRICDNNMYRYRITLFDGIEDNVFIFSSLQDFYTYKKYTDYDLIIDENDFRKIWLLDYDHDKGFNRLYKKYIKYGKIDCNNCKHISMSEQKQRELNCIMPHICTKYGTRVFHNSCSSDAYYLYPCKRCKEDLFYEFEASEEYSKRNEYINERN